MKPVWFCVSVLATSLGECVVFKDGAYSGLQVKIAEDTPVDDCKHIIHTLQVIIVMIVSCPRGQRPRQSF